MPVWGCKRKSESQPKFETLSFCVTAAGADTEVSFLWSETTWQQRFSPHIGFPSDLQLGQHCQRVLLLGCTSHQTLLCPGLLPACLLPAELPQSTASADPKALQTCALGPKAAGSKKPSSFASFPLSHSMTIHSRLQVAFICRPPTLLDV